MANCDKCGKFGATIPYGDGFVCAECAITMNTAPTQCPVCNTLSNPDEAVAMLLTSATASDAQRLAAEVTYVNVCPKCHVLFFDEIQYGFLQGLMSKK